MATLAALKTKIILMLNRDDLGSGQALEQALTDVLAEVVEDYADEEFWFNRYSGTVPTVAGTRTVALSAATPATARRINQVAYNGVPLRKRALSEIQAGTEAGTPRYWASSGSTITLYPIPGAVVTLGLYGVIDLGVPATTNAWSVEGLALVQAGAVMRLQRDYLRDPEGAALAAKAESVALDKLRRETRRRGRAPLTSDLPCVGAYSEDLMR